MGVVQSLARRSATIPGLRNVLELLHERRFARAAPTAGNWYRGVYASFAEAEASAPSTRPLGYDHAETAALYRERTRRVYTSDYPMMFWLERVFRSGAASVFDIGGHIGIAYYAYQRYLTFPEHIHWCVLDVPAVNAAGIAYAAEHDARARLRFSAEPTDADGCDIVFASGSLQYLDYTLADLLASLRQRPRHLLINLMPIHMSESFFTVQNMGAAFCPYRITAERAFIDGLKTLGYTLVDRWENLDRRCEIAFRPTHSLDRYFGFCFSRAEN